MVKYYFCSVCGNLVEKIEDGGNTPACCGRQMIELRPASTDGALEKHVPFVTIHEYCEDVKRVNISVGKILHPHDPSHHIKWIELITDKGVYRRELPVSCEPSVNIYIQKDEQVKYASAYCNLHGLYNNLET